MTADEGERLRLACTKALMPFLYEPATEGVAGRLATAVAEQASAAFGALCRAEADFCPDLEARPEFRRECAEAGSYEEYRVRRAAAGLPDEAGSERAWRRAAGWRPGSVFVSVELPSGPATFFV